MLSLPDNLVLNPNHLIFGLEFPLAPADCDIEFAPGQVCLHHINELYGERDASPAFALHLSSFHDKQLFLPDPPPPPLQLMNLHMIQPSESPFAPPAHVLSASANDCSPPPMAKSNPLAFLLREAGCNTDDPFGFLNSSSYPEGAPSPVTDLPDHARLEVFSEFEQ